MKKLFFILLTLSALVTSQAQENCTAYYPFDIGKEFEITNYNAKGKIDSKSIHKIVDARSISGGMEALINLELFDKNNELITQAQYEVQCANGSFYIDMASMVSPQLLNGMNADATIDGDFLEFTNNMTPGTILPDATMNINVGSDGMSIMNVSMNITNRKVGENETRTTPAGTFNCLSMSHDFSTKIMVTINGSAKTWYAENVGMVRSESYNKKGKLTGYSELTSLTN